MIENSYSDENTYWCKFDNIYNLKPIPGIYILYCITSGKYYIGETINIKKRMGEHMRSKNQLIHKVIKRRGLENFLYYIEYFPNFKKEDLLPIEESLIIKYNSLVPNGYNICEKGSDQTNRVFSEEHKRKMSEAKIGKKLSEYTKSKISKSHTGRKLSDSHKQRISQSNLGKKMSDESKEKISNSSKGVGRKPLTEEHKNNISKSRKGKKHSEEHIKNFVASRIGKKYSKKPKEISKI